MGRERLRDRDCREQGDGRSRLRGTSPCLTQSLTHSVAQSINHSLAHSLSLCQVFKQHGYILPDDDFVAYFELDKGTLPAGPRVPLVYTWATQPNKTANPSAWIVENKTYTHIEYVHPRLVGDGGGSPHPRSWIAPLTRFRWRSPARRYGTPSADTFKIPAACKDIPSCRTGAGRTSAAAELKRMLAKGQ